MARSGTDSDYGSSFENISKPKGDVYDIRLVLVGKTGAGKSATGNTLLKSKDFQEGGTVNAVTQEPEKLFTYYGDSKSYTRLFVIDTPGIGDANKTDEEIMAKIRFGYRLAAPGLHAIVVVVSLYGRFTDDDVKTLKFIKELFGDDCMKYVIVLFSHADYLLKDGSKLKEVIESNKAMFEFVTDCNGRYMAFDNTDESKHQVKQFIKMIKKMNEVNGMKLFTNTDLQKEEAYVMKRVNDLKKQNEEELLSYVREMMDKLFLPELEILRKRVTDLETENRNLKRSKVCSIS